MGFNVLDSLTHLALALLFCIFLSKLARSFFLPEMVPEFLTGVILGNFGSWVGLNFNHLNESAVLQTLSTIGLILLSFSIALDTGIKEIGKSKNRFFTLLMVWLLVSGTCLFFCHKAFQGVDPIKIAFLIGTSLTLSVSASFYETGLYRSRFLFLAPVIFGLAFIGNIFAIITGSVATAWISREGFSVIQKVVIILFEISFCVVAVYLFRVLLIPTIIKRFRLFEIPHSFTLLLVSLTILFCWGSSSMGLIAVAGPFALGLILDHSVIRRLSRDSGTLEDLMAPLLNVVVPLFFISLGLKVDLSVFNHAEAFKLFALFTGVSFLLKFTCILLSPWKAEVGNRSKQIIFLSSLAQGEMGFIFIALGYQVGILQRLEFSVAALVILSFTVFSQSFLRFIIYKEQAPWPILP